MKAQVRYHAPGYDPTMNQRPPDSLLPYLMRQIALGGCLLSFLACGGVFFLAYSAGQSAAQNALATSQATLLATEELLLTEEVMLTEEPVLTEEPTLTPSITLTPSETPTGTLTPSATPTNTPDVSSIQASATALSQQWARPSVTPTPTATFTSTSQPRSGPPRVVTQIVTVPDVQEKRVVVTAPPVVIVRTQIVEVTRVLKVSQTPQPTQVEILPTTQTLQASPTSGDSTATATATAVLVIPTAAPTSTHTPTETATLTPTPTSTAIEAAPIEEMSDDS